jgi:hypothetical protein
MFIVFLAPRHLIRQSLLTQSRGELRVASVLTLRLRLVVVTMNLILPEIG